MAMKEIIYGICGTSRCKLPTYSKEKIDEFLEGKANSKNVYTKEEIDSRTLTKEITTEGTDLNEYVTNGTYFFNATNTPINRPPIDVTRGWLEVIARNENDVKQIWYVFNANNNNNNKKFERVKTSGEWGEWVRNIDESDVYVKGNYAVLTGSITLSDGAGSRTHAYPTDFTANNCVVISVNIGQTSNEEIPYSCGILPDVAGWATGAIYHRVSLRTDDVVVGIDNGSKSGTNKYNYKVVLMKIS
jgi:hypothetical protein